MPSVAQSSPQTKSTTYVTLQRRRTLGQDRRFQPRRGHPVRDAARPARLLRSRM